MADHRTIVVRGCYLQVLTPLALYPRLLELPAEHLQVLARRARSKQLAEAGRVGPLGPPAADVRAASSTVIDEVLLAAVIKPRLVRWAWQASLDAIWIGDLAEPIKLELFASITITG